jgi:hypothetical protein
MPRLITILLVALALANAATAQTEQKAQVIATNLRNDAVVLKYEYTLREYSWSIMTHELGGNDEVTYRRPANLPGCKQLMEWGLDKGRFVVYARGNELCDEPMSICETTSYTLTIRNVSCQWQRQ